MFTKRNKKSSERVALSSWKKKKKGKDGDPQLPSNRIVTSSCVRGRTVKLLVTQSVCEEHLTKKRADFRVTPSRRFSVTEANSLGNSIRWLHRLAITRIDSRISDEFLKNWSLNVNVWLIDTVILTISAIKSLNYNVILVTSFYRITNLSITFP